MRVGTMAAAPAQLLPRRQRDAPWLRDSNAETTMDVSADHTVDRDTPSFSSFSSHARSGAATARTYYDSHDADTFYRTIWGSSTIKIGLYDSPNDPIHAVFTRTIERMAALLAPITSATRILDLGSGYGGAARYLARTYGCKVCW
ncbi:hypothetical protein HO173_009656 [Letharia columbiana]|uniref:Uncharacterized protein n=1 Tax=Letharia columbiana TaxID=112416 RepID=A0A8H6FP12_9LECA|nr:uncharacterized protein HO173_009656 [Letharia columbiana]KAF6232062.1 hypothetical protein HO173_009656 [Letharia columbiana]